MHAHTCSSAKLRPLSLKVWNRNSLPNPNAGHGRGAPADAATFAGAIWRRPESCARAAPRQVLMTAHRENREVARTMWGCTKTQ